MGLVWTPSIGRWVMRFNLTIDNPGTPENPDYGPYVQTVEFSPWPGDPDETYASFDLPFDIPPGYVVSITDDVMTRTHTVTDVEVTIVNANTISSLALPHLAGRLKWGLKGILTRPSPMETVIGPSIQQYV